MAAPQPVGSTIPPCEFEIGDVVAREGVGAVVPTRGQGVGGNFDGVDRSGSIDISTSEDGVVTITSEVTGKPRTVEVCRLA